MGPLCLLFATRTSAPAQFLFQETERCFNLLAGAILSFDFMGSEGQIVRAPVAPSVFDDQYRMFHAPYFSSRMALPLRPRRPQGLVTKLAGTLEPHPILPPQPSSKFMSSAAAYQLSHRTYAGCSPRRRAWRSKPSASSTFEGPPLRPSRIPSATFPMEVQEFLRGLFNAVDHNFFEDSAQNPFFTAVCT